MRTLYPMVLLAAVATGCGPAPRLERAMDGRAPSQQFVQVRRLPGGGLRVARRRGRLGAELAALVRPFLEAEGDRRGAAGLVAAEHRRSQADDDLPCAGRRFSQNGLRLRPEIRERRPRPDDRRVRWAAGGGARRGRLDRTRRREENREAAGSRRGSRRGRKHQDHQPGVQGAVGAGHRSAVAGEAGGRFSDHAGRRRDPQGRAVGSAYLDLSGGRRRRDE